jgi:murein DD-endopeptidase MepM/ murein hydrolase activator NlpD
VKPGTRRSRTIPLVIVSFYLGGIAGWWLHASRIGVRPPVVASEAPVDRVAPTSGIVEADPAARPAAPRNPRPAAPLSSDTPAASPSILAAEESSRSAVDALQHHNLRVPLDNVDIASMKGAFTQRRDGTRQHEAVDLLAPRNTPIHAVERGTIVKLFTSKAGGTTIYQFDPTERFCYYYAHLERYAPGLREGQYVSRGEVIGYVGTSGNAPPDTPHLHFAIFELTPEKHWWEGRAIDPYLVFAPQM